MNTKLFTSLQDFRASLNQSFLERSAVIDGLLASLITKQNAFLFGLPGTGKSELVRAVANGFSGSKFFGYLLSPTTDPSELFGPVAVSKLLQDEYTRDVDGYLPSADIAFLDELFRGSSAVLNSLLTLLNERLFNNGKQVITTPIQSIVAATNSFPQDESLQAFCDRFLFRPTVDGLKLPASKRTLDAWALGLHKRPVLESRLSMEDLAALQSEVMNVQPHEQFLDAFNDVLERLETRGLRISDRRRVQILKFMRGWALVQGDDQVYGEHLHDTLIHIVYQTPEDFSVIKEVLEEVVPTADKILLAITRASHGLAAEFHTLQSNGNVRDLRGMNDQVASLRRIHKDLQLLETKVDQLLNENKMRITAKGRMDSVKLTQKIDNLKQRVAKAIGDYTK